MKAAELRGGDIGCDPEGELIEAPIHAVENIRAMSGRSEAQVPASHHPDRIRLGH